jgi:hypothetical protein
MASFAKSRRVGQFDNRKTIVRALHNDLRDRHLFGRAVPAGTVPERQANILPLTLHGSHAHRDYTSNQRKCSVPHNSPHCTPAYTHRFRNYSGSDGRIPATNSRDISPDFEGFLVAAEKNGPSADLGQREFSLCNSELVSHHRPDGTVNPVSRRRRVRVADRSVCLLVSGPRRACGRPHADDLPVPSAHTSEQTELSVLCHAYAWQHHLLSDRSEALSSPLNGACDAVLGHDRKSEKEPMAARLQYKHEMAFSKNGPNADANDIPAFGPRRQTLGGQRGEALVSCNAYEVSTCTVTYRSAWRAPRNYTDKKVGHRQKCRSTDLARLQSLSGRSKPQPCLPKLPAAKSEQPSDGCQANSSRRPASSPRSLSRSRNEIEFGGWHPRWVHGPENRARLCRDGSIPSPSAIRPASSVVERLFCKQRVGGSIPSLGSIATAKTGSRPHDLEVRIGAAGKGPRIIMRAQQARSTCGDRSAGLIQSSGDGLGIHLPGSMTRGFAAERQPASGRARDRAICPAVTRSSFCNRGCTHADYCWHFGCPFVEGE